MTVAAICIPLCLALLASSTPLHLFTPQTLTTTSLDATNSLLLNTTALTAVTNCFIQPQHPGAPVLFETDYGDCLVAVDVLLSNKQTLTPYTFGRKPETDVRLPYSRSFRTCKIIIDIVDEYETDRLRWRDISDRLEAPSGILRKCLGQGTLPPLGGRTTVGSKEILQAIVVGQPWKPDAVN